MSRKIVVLGLCFGFLFVAVSITGCAFGNFGKANVTYTDINVPSGLNGQSKASIITTLGVPDCVANTGITEYWAYKNKSGFFVVLFGKTQAKDLVLEIKKGKVTSSYLVDKGSSMGIFAPQGAVAN